MTPNIRNLTAAALALASVLAVRAVRADDWTAPLHLIHTIDCYSIADVKERGVSVVSNAVAHLDAPLCYAATNAVVALNRSAQYINPDGTATVAILPPDTVSGHIRDWVVYAYPTADTEVDFSALLHARFADDSVTNALPANVYTALYFTEIDPATRTFAIGRTALEKGW